MQNLIKVLNYQMTITDNINNLRFQKDKIAYKAKTLDAIFSNEAKDLLKGEMAKQGLKYPVELSLSSHDYFIKKKEYTRKDGTQGEKYVVVITGFQSLAQGEFPQNKTLDDVVDEIIHPVSDE